MQKKEFIRLLRMELDFLTKAEREEAISYYEELIADAVDSGASEEQFIDGLGSIAQIALNIRNDRGYIVKEKQKQMIDVNEVVSATTKFVTYAVFVIVTIIGSSILFAFFTSAIAILVTAIMSIIRQDPLDSIFLASRIGMMLVSSGMIFIVIAVIQLYVKHAKKIIIDFMNTIKGWFKKGGASHE